MSHRAQYVVRLKKSLAFFYSRNGALGVPQDLFWGPNYAEAAIRCYVPCRQRVWLEDLGGCEGGVALDRDKRGLVFYGALASGWGGPAEVHLLLDLMATQWPGWSLRWAWGGMEDVSAHVDLAPPGGTNDDCYDRPEPVDLETVGGLLRETGVAHTLITMRGEGGEYVDRVVESFADDLLAAGPALLAVVGGLPGVAEGTQAFARRPPPTSQFDPTSFLESLEDAVFIDVRERTIALFVSSYEYRVRRAACLQSVWPGWSVRVHAGGVHAYVGQYGRWPEGIEMPVDRRPSEKELLASIKRKVVDCYGEGAAFRQVPDALRAPTPDVNSEAALDAHTVAPKLFARAVAEYKRQKRANRSP